MMTEPLSWECWRKVYLNKKHKKRASLERWGLRNLHSVEALDHIVSEVKKTYLNNNPYINVSANSVWVDGTPQAKFTVSKYENENISSTSYGNTNQVSLKARKDEVLNCELADLLFIFNEFNSQNGFKKVRAVLLQGKCSEKYNLLPDGPSTEKERKLLESVNREELLTLYPGTKASGNEIGTYKLGGDQPGLADCAKYLMMPKYEAWNYKTPANTDPYVIGWPENSSSKSLGVTQNYLDAVIYEMLTSQTMGREVKFNNGDIDRTCEWSKMIDDLLTSYHGVTMKGYDCQRRFYKSSGYIPSHIKGLSLMIDDVSFLSLLQMDYDDFVWYYRTRYDYFQKKHGIQVATFIQNKFGQYLNLLISEQGPIISTIIINIDYHEGEYSRD
ncbi:lysogenic conversion protein [Enterobacter hormaechei]|uniref:lysogenic conversion protein n=1 Tax=Enterobacter hormaechei TaxID=158836 RepID=UPI000F870F8A|nr:lysogenic conversion protein [Enterobacter hormaechei]RUO06582.1 lysogenic conversion protein [Enterobacter hormaechei]